MAAAAPSEPVAWPDCVLVAGGAGFIGANFVRHALAAAGPPRVVTVDALTYAASPESLAALPAADRHTFVHADINDGARMAALLAEHRPDWVVNFAAETHVDRSLDAPHRFLDANVSGAFHLLEACHRHWDGLDGTARDRFRFLQISTDEVFGVAEAGARFTEDSPYAPTSPYAASKAAADHLVGAYHHSFGFPALITNCANNYGPYQFPEKLIPLMLASALREAPLPVYGDGEHVREWLYVEDHCRALALVLARAAPGARYLVGGEERRNIDVVVALCELMDRLRPRANGRSHKDLIEFVADRPGHDRRYAIDDRRLRDDLCWRPETGFEAGLEATARWYLGNRAWLVDVGARYGGERLGLSRAGGAS